MWTVPNALPMPITLSTIPSVDDPSVDDPSVNLDTEVPSADAYGADPSRRSLC